MKTPARADLTARRYQPFILIVDAVGQDWTGADLKLQVRATQSAPGAALIDLSVAAAGSEGLSISVATTLGIPTTTLTIQIDEATLTATTPYPGNGLEPNTPVSLRYDLVVTPSGGIKQRWLEGAFIIVEGVTR